ncbi:MAG: amidohydrolase family protein [Candidatus Freyarchaeota archaeon]|nr:amidohydrolase family protein [Candidatus Freyrarchaeum guaymaensis]
MLLLNDKDEGKTIGFFVVDVHTHLGKEEVMDGRGVAYRSNTPRQTIDFYHRLQFEIRSSIDSSPDKYRFTPASPLTMPPPPLKPFYDAIGRSWGWTVDQFVAFPFNDFRAYSTKPSFQKPNNLILKRSLTLPFSPRLLGFIRVDPHDGEDAVKEVERCAEIGARGLKLHPISQNFLDEILSKNVKNVTLAAVNNGLPVLFDCRYYATAEDIYQLTQEVRGEAKRGDFAIILGHSCMEYAKDGLYEILGDPNIYGDTSGVRGDDIPLFFRKLKSHLEDSWSSKILFGTDYNYFTIPQALDFITYLLTWEFHEETDASWMDIQRILGANALSLIKPYIHRSRGEIFFATLKGTAQDAFLSSLQRRLSEKARRKEVNSLTYDPLVTGRGRIDPSSFISSFGKMDGGQMRAILFKKSLLHPEQAMIISIPIKPPFLPNLRIRSHNSSQYFEIVRFSLTRKPVEASSSIDAEKLTEKICRL